MRRGADRGARLAGRELELEPLGGGITNRNFVVHVDGEALRAPDRGRGHRAASGSTGPPSTRRPASPPGSGSDPRSSSSSSRARSSRASSRAARPGRRRSAGRMPARGRADAPAHPRGPARSRRGSTRFASSRPTARPRRRTASACPPRYERAPRPAPTRSSAARGAQPAQPCHNDLLNANFIARRRRGSASSTGSTRAWATASSTSRTSPSTTSSARPRADALLDAYFGEVTRARRASVSA